MSDLQLRGTTTVCGIKVPNIEGGFGPDKRSMMVKDIAELHNKELYKVNELIANNKKRFNDNIDIIDILGTEFVILLRDNGILTQNSINRAEHIYIVSERGYTKLLKIFDDDLAWERYDQVMDDYFELRSQARSVPGHISYKEQMEVASFVADDLKVNEASRILMFQKVSKNNGVDPSYLPAYTEEKLTKSATQLLKEHNNPMSAQAFNVLLINAGFLVEASRPSSSGKTKTFKKLTDNGLKYGKNIISPNNQKETQPHYYEDTFGELLGLCGVIREEVTH